VTAAQMEAQAEKAHRRERWWLIGVPMLLGGLIVLALAGWVIGQGQGQTVSQAASAVVIYASLLCLLGGLPVLAVLVGLIVVVVQAQRRAPEVTQQLLDGLLTLRRTLLALTDKTATPWIRWQSRLASWKALVRAFLRGGRTHDNA